MGQGRRYRVVFLGPAERDFQLVDRLVENLQKVFGLSLQAVTYMMRAVPYTLKRGATLQEALKYKKAFEAIGAKVVLEEMVEQWSPPPSGGSLYGFSGALREKPPIRVKYPEDGGLTDLHA